MGRIKFGKFLLAENAINIHELIIALEKQKLFGGKIGRNLVECGYLLKEDLETYLNIYKEEIMFS